MINVDFENKNFKEQMDAWIAREQRMLRRRYHITLEKTITVGVEIASFLVILLIVAVVFFALRRFT